MTGPSKVFKDGSGQLLVVVEEATAKLVHEEHGVIEVPRGTWEVVRQREYSPQALRRVQD